MLENLALGLASLWNQSFDGITYWEAPLSLSENPVKIEAPIEFTTLGIWDDEDLPAIYFRANERDGWRELHHDHEYENETEILSGEPRNFIWLKSEAPVEGKIVFLDTRIPGENLVARFDPFDDDSNDDPLSGLPKKIDPPEYISRVDWGADESLRVWKPFRGFKAYFRDIVPEAKQLPRYLRPKIIARKDDQDRELTWPVEENRKLKKFIIHHTGEVIDESRNPMELMRAIYAFHTLSRGWGDIGYNYVIDRRGNIYQGRAGGPKIVGAHTAYHNVASMGVSRMGNFNSEEPTEAQLHVLTLLLADHALRFDVDPTGRERFLGKNSHNITGHRHVARKGHGTACPGAKLIEKLPWIREETARKLEGMRTKPGKTGRDFLAMSSAAEGIQRKKVFRREEKVPNIDLAELLRADLFKRGEKGILEVKMRNGSKFDWPKGATLEVGNIPDGMLIGKFRSTEKIRSGHTGTFRARAYIKTTPNGEYTLSLTPKIFQSRQDVIFKKVSFPYPIQISGTKGSLFKRLKPSNLKAAKTKPLIDKKSARSRKIHEKVALGPSQGPAVKVKLSYFDQKMAYLRTDQKMYVFNKKNELVLVVSEREKIKVFPSTQKGHVHIVYGKKKMDLIDPKFKTEGIIEIQNYDRGLGNLKYNTFRGQINVHLTKAEDGKTGLLLVNQLPIREYLWGLGEEPKTEPTEKKHAIHILARSYALVYSGARRKFRTNLYDLEDSPRTSQLYLGYEWEKYHPEQKNLLEKTKGMVITYQGKPVIGPYFTQSSGRNSGKWRSQYPWTKDQPLPYDQGLEARGHGVGLSGNTSRKLAQMGRNYEEILHYFFDGIEVKKVY